MAIRCPSCKREHDVTLFEFGKAIKCSCGSVVTLRHEEIFKELINNEEERVNEIRNLADKIAFLIVSTDYPRIDIEIEKEKLREKINELFPDKVYLYDLIYESRFMRLEEQFRKE